jgi:cysteinyl-tRNA synthetase
VKIRDFVNKYGGQVLRHILLTVHYRARLEWSEEVVQKGIDEVRRLHEFVVETKSYKANGSGTDPEIEGCIAKMEDELTNDFNSAGALGHFFTFLRYVKGKKDQLSAESIATIQKTIKYVQDSMGLINANPEAVLAQLAKLDHDAASAGVDAAWIEGLIEERKTAKASKNWARADEIRKELSAKNVVLKDNPDGSTSWKIG